jgi:hypothetical protein
MDVSASALETICRIPDAYYGWTHPSAQQSWRRLVAASGYAALRPHLSRDALGRFLRAHPETIEQWVRYSEGKRTSGGWGFQQQGANWVIGRFDRRMQWMQHVVGPDGADACAEYILRELDWYVVLARAEAEFTPPAP